MRTGICKQHHQALIGSDQLRTRKDVSVYNQTRHSLGTSIGFWRKRINMLDELCVNGGFLPYVNVLLFDVRSVSRKRAA